MILTGYTALPDLNKHVNAYTGNTYDFDNEIVLKWYANRVTEKADASNSILELGLGHGYSSVIFNNYFQNHVILEGSTSVIKHFRKNHPQCDSEIIETYFEEYESDTKFDVIVMGFVLEHVDNPLEIIKHYKQFLTPGGSLFVAVPNAESLNRRLGNLAGLLTDIHKLSENDILLGHKRYYTVDSINEQIEQAGFSVDSLEGIYLKPFTTAQIMSLNFEQNILDAMCQIGTQYPELSCGLLATAKVSK